MQLNNASVVNNAFAECVMRLTLQSVFNVKWELLLTALQTAILAQSVAQNATPINKKITKEKLQHKQDFSNNQDFYRVNRADSYNNSPRRLINKSTQTMIILAEEIQQIEEFQEISQRDQLTIA